MSSKDDNGQPIAFGVSHIDGITPVPISFSPNGRMGTDSVTSILFSPTTNRTQTDNDYPLAKATSSDNNTTVLPWVVNATNGKVLISL